MKIINIVDNATPVNTGIWNAAVSTAEALKNCYDVDSELWYPNMEEELHLPYCVSVPLKSRDLKYVSEMISERSLSPKDTIIITHGCWQYPTRWGKKFKSLGYRWVFVPHGMLEPWSLNQKKWLKMLFFFLIEKPYAKKADFIRAVGSPERENLYKYFKNVKLIPNGVRMPQRDEALIKGDNPIIFVFMARLHHKKGIKPLVKAWKSSKANDRPKYELHIAGPDHGELDEVLADIKSSKNMKYLGMVKGSEKHQLLSKGHFYILPSFSEGFPTSVVEALSYGLVPLITLGCNFPEAIGNKYALEITTDEKDILEMINKLVDGNVEKINNKAIENYEYILRSYSIEHVAEMQYKMYHLLLSSSI